MAITWRDAWGEHGAWAIVLSCYVAGLIISRPPSLAGYLLFPSVVLLTAGKGIAKKASRTGRGLAVLSLVGIVGVLTAVPAALSAPKVFILIAVLTVPFICVYFFFAKSVKVTRSLQVELYGVILLSSVSTLVIATSKSHGIKEALLVWPLFAVLFLPGVARAKLLKNQSMVLNFFPACENLFQSAPGA